MSAHFKHLLNIIPDLADRRVLDVGCGDGEFLAACPKGTGIEINHDKVAIAKARFPQVDVQHANAEEIPFADNSFDFVNLEELIEHVKNPQKVLTEVRRVLYPKGLAYISVPNRFGWFDPHFRIPFVNWLPRSMSDAYISLLHAKGEKSYQGVDRQRLSDMHYFTPLGFRRFAEKIGFRVIDIREMKIKNGFNFLLPLYPAIRSWFFRTNHFLLVV